MRKSSFWTVYLMLTLFQLVLSTYGSFSPYVTISILPVMVLCIPTRIKTPVAMIVAFATGLVVDWLSEGVLGLNAFALVPVALLRDGIIRAVFGSGLFARKEDFSIAKNGLPYVAFAVSMAQAMFLVLYIWADGAGTRPFGFNAARFGASLVVSFIAAMLSVNALSPSDR